MELTLSPEDAAFRDEMRAFIANNYPAEMRVLNPDTDLTKEQMLLWHRILHKKGWIAPLWPKEYGGPGWSITRRFIFEQETTRAGTLPPLAFSVTMVGPVIYILLATRPRRRSSCRGSCRARTGGVVADQAVQLHGGMGMTDELNIGHYFKRISSINVQFGDPAYHVLRYALRGRLKTRGTYEH